MTVMETRQFYLASKALVVYQLYVVGNPGVEPGISPILMGYDLLPIRLMIPHSFYYFTPILQA
jgi:hypothetical protein